MRVCNKQIHLLPGFVQSGGRFAATENHLIRSQRKHGIDTAGIVASPLHKTERRILHLRRISITQSSGLTQDTSGFILQHDSPGILVNLNGSVIAGINNVVIRLGHFPASIPARLFGQHDGSGRSGLHRSGQHADTHRTRSYKVNLKFQVRVILISSKRKIEHSHFTGLCTVGIESLTGHQMPPFPVHQSFTRLNVE